ncbi:segregation and condensation protein A, partial [Geminisphaera colitermitum]|uniref:segregation and condensation protein A n=1 Tax=Geminisphaera colitermitum TaxID=1148786 RepID=UPI0005BAF749
AGKLDALSVFQRDMLPRHVAIETVTEADRALKPADKIELWNVFNNILRRLAQKLVVGEIQDEQVTVSDKMEELLALTTTRKTFLFTELFTERVTIRVLVATFIAVLELTRLRKLRIHQDEAYTDIICTAVEDAAPAQENEKPLETPGEPNTVTL